MTNYNKTTVSKVVGTRTYAIKLSKLQELRSYLNVIFINETGYLGDTSISYNLSNLVIRLLKIYILGGLQIEENIYDIIYVCIDL